jgi:hypothetical protein
MLLLSTESTGEFFRLTLGPASFISDEARLAAYFIVRVHSRTGRYVDWCYRVVSDFAVHSLSFREDALRSVLACQMAVIYDQLIQLKSLAERGLFIKHWPFGRARQFQRVELLPWKHQLDRRWESWYL